jgi:5'-deoxynucleotidase YfbR-like HD superfamily hydrolase
MKISEAFEGENSSLKKTFDKCCGSEELKKEWRERALDDSYENKLYFGDGGLYEDKIADWWLEKFAKQQEEFDKIKNSGRKMYELGKKEAQEEFVKGVEEFIKANWHKIERIDRYVLDDLLADIKSKLNK